MCPQLMWFLPQLVALLVVTVAEGRSISAAESPNPTALHGHDDHCHRDLTHADTESLCSALCQPTCAVPSTCMRWLQVMVFDGCLRLCKLQDPITFWCRDMPSAGLVNGCPTFMHHRIRSQRSGIQNFAMSKWGLTPELLPTQRDVPQSGLVLQVITVAAGVTRMLMVRAVNERTIIGTRCRVSTESFQMVMLA